MNIRAADIVGSMRDAPVQAVAPAKAMESPPSSRQAGGNGDVHPAQLKQMVEEMQSQLESMNVSLEYSLYGKNGSRIAVKVMNKDTGEVIREIPAKEMQALQAKMSELVGMIFNEKG